MERWQHLQERAVSCGWKLRRRYDIHSWCLIFPIILLIPKSFYSIDIYFHFFLPYDWQHQNYRQSQTIHWKGIRPGQHCLNGWPISQAYQPRWSINPQVCFSPLLLEYRWLTRKAPCWQFLCFQWYWEIDFESHIPRVFVNSVRIWADRGREVILDWGVWGEGNSADVLGRHFHEQEDRKR